jgi:uncharacterized secreted protein with C-terminal beta-propeller domain
VGPSADDTGRTTGEQVSVYDVRDLDQPSLVNRVEFPGSYSMVDYDPHAFLFWQPRALTIIPLVTYGEATSAGVVLQTTQEGVVEVGRVRHPTDPQCQCSFPLDRALVLDDTLYTVSTLWGVQATNLDTLADEGWVAFPT